MNYTYKKELNVKYDVDVFIAGGGPAGVAAAVTAARNGASVFIIEAFGAFGGAAVNALIPAFMPFTDGINFLAGGIGQEVYDYIKKNRPECCQNYCPDSIPVETLKLCYDEMITKSGAQFAFFTSLNDIISENGKIQYAICSGKGETYAVKAKVFIDCTGDGDLAAMAGAKYEKGNADGEMMAATLCAIWNDIEWNRVIRPDSRRLTDAFSNGVFTNKDLHLPGMWPVSTTTGGSNAGHIYDIDGTDAQSLTKAMIAGRQQLKEYLKYYKEYLNGYENSQITISASMIGIRETRRITGDYILNADDFLNRADFMDEIGRYAYPVDIHAGKNTSQGYDEYKKKFAQLRYQKGESYGIPYRSLLVNETENILTAGRCISADRNMQSSVRVMPCCFITGQAAGMAAAIAANDNAKVRDISIENLQKSLKAIGAFLPNTK